MPRTVNQALREERRKTILSAAERIFSRQGFAQTTISRIAADAGISHAAVFQYFSSKEELFRAVISESIEQGNRFYNEILLGAGRPVERLQKLVNNQIRIALKHSAYFRLVQQILAQPEFYPELVQELDEFAEAFCQLVVGVIEEGQQLKELGVGDAREIARAYFAYWNGIGLSIRDWDDNTVRHLTDNGLKLFGIIIDAGMS